MLPRRSNTVLGHYPPPPLRTSLGLDGPKSLQVAAGDGGAATVAVALQIYLAGCLWIISERGLDCALACNAARLRGALCGWSVCRGRNVCVDCVAELAASASNTTLMARRFTPAETCPPARWGVARSSAG